MRTVESIGRAPSIAPDARTCTTSPADLHQIIATVVTLHPDGAAKWLQRVTGRAARTVKYWLAGDYSPRGKDTLKIAAALRAELADHQQRLQQFELQF
jgi:hypothetical protein